MANNLLSSIKNSTVVSKTHAWLRTRWNSGYVGKIVVLILVGVVGGLIYLVIKAASSLSRRTR